MSNSPLQMGPSLTQAKPLRGWLGRGHDVALDSPLSQPHFQQLLTPLLCPRLPAFSREPPAGQAEPDLPKVTAFPPHQQLSYHPAFGATGMLVTHATQDPKGASVRDPTLDAAGSP